ncbi:hypothetical protein A5678_17945 [Mycobacterium sp. E2733]|nr:hypothetical protein A5678_17945 [Mycobacterium sp. E2733]
MELDDECHVGLSVGGHGVPLVFMHGIMLSRRAYLQMLSRVAGLGFLVVAIDAAGHGDTGRLPSNACAFTDRADSVLRTLDALGLGPAVFVGHSMGGRMAIHLAARAPERVLAAVLLDPAAGASFDTALQKLVRSPGRALSAASAAVLDAVNDPWRMIAGDQASYLWLLASVSRPNFSHPSGPIQTMKAIVESGDSTPMLHIMREEGMPTFVLHGEKDMVVPFGSARDIADHANATLYRVPGEHHMWMIANPRQGADALRQLLHGELGEVLRTAADAIGIDDINDHGAWERKMLDPDGLLFEFLQDGTDVIGEEELDHVELELVREAERTHERMSWAGRTCRRWAAEHRHETRSGIRQNVRIRPDRQH